MLQKIDELKIGLKKIAISVKPLSLFHHCIQEEDPTRNRYIDSVSIGILRTDNCLRFQVNYFYAFITSAYNFVASFNYYCISNVVKILFHVYISHILFLHFSASRRYPPILERKGKWIVGVDLRKNGDFFPPIYRCISTAKRTIYSLGVDTFVLTKITKSLFLSLTGR